MRRLRDPGRYWKAALGLGLLFFAAAVVPTRGAHVVDPSGCRSVPATLLFGPHQACPVYRESFHGGIWVFAASVTTRSVGTTDAPGFMAERSSVPLGFRVPAFLGDLAVSLLLGVPAALLALLLSGRLRRTPPYGAVRNRRHIRLSKRRF